MNTALKIILVDENSGRSAMLRRALQDQGHEVICRMTSSSQLIDSNEMTHADVVIVNADIPIKISLSLLLCLLNSQILK